MGRSLWQVDRRQIGVREHRAFIRYKNVSLLLNINIYYQNGKSLVTTTRKVYPVSSRNNDSSSSTVKTIIEKFENSGSGSLETNIASVREIVTETSQELVIFNTLYRILTLKISIFMLLKCNWVDILCQQIMCSEESWLIGSLKNKKSIPIMWTKSSKDTRSSFISKSSLISTTAVFGLTKYMNDCKGKK